VVKARAASGGFDAARANRRPRFRFGADCRKDWTDTKLALADSVVLATARQADCDIVTQDADFEGLPG